MVWAKMETNTLTSTSLDINLGATTPFTAKKFTQHLFHGIDDGTGSSGDCVTRTRPDNTGGTAYAHRVSEDGSADSTFTSQDGIYHALNVATDDHFIIDYICGITGEELLQIGFFIDAVASGATSAPTRAEIVNKYTGTPEFTSLYNNNTRGTTIGYEFDVGSNATILTGDETEIATLQDGTIFEETDTNKAYIWSSSSQTWTQL